MSFRIIKDEFYKRITKELKSHVPEFISVFDDTDNVYLILGEFGRFMIQNVDDKRIIEKCFRFLDVAIQKGSYETEDVIAIQVFEQFDNEKSLTESAEKYLQGRSLEIFEKYLK